MSRLKILFFFLLPIVVYSQTGKKQFAFGSLSIKEGLSQNSVISIAQDSIGYLWLATQDGLNKYNGKSFTVFNKQFEDITRPTFSKLGKVYIDKKNQLWIVSNSGVLEYFNVESKNFIKVLGIQNASTVFQDKQLNHYIGTYNKGLFKINAVSKDTIQVFRGEDRNKTVYDFLEHNDTLYVACSETIFAFSKNTDYKKVKIHNAKNVNFSCLEQSKNGTLWVGTYGHGLFFKTKNSKGFKPISNSGLPSNLNIEDLLVDSKNRLWIATYGNGVYLYDLKTGVVSNFLANKENPFDLHYNDILTLFEDNTGVIWIGSDGAGASYYDEHLIKFNVLTNKQLSKNVNVDVVRSITSNNENLVWVGTSGKGLTYMDIASQTYKTFTESNVIGLNSNRIVSLNFFNQSLWIGHQGFGLNIFENGIYKNYPEISDYTIWRIIKASDTSSWLCTERNGLVLFDKEKGILKQFNNSNSKLTSNNIRAMVKGENGTLWIGTENNGLFKLQTDTGLIIKINEIADPIKSLLYHKGVLWVGTYGKGLKKYDLASQTTKTYTVEDGMPNNVIYGILCDNEENLWLSSNYGLSKFNTKAASKPVIKNYTDADGLQNLEFNTGAYYQDANGIIYFGGLDGINWFDPNQLTFNSTKPKTVISKFEVFSKPYELKENQTLNFNENTVTFTFSSLLFSAPDRNQFKYQLVNHDSTWVDAGNKHMAHYTNLPSNKYTFKVLSSNYDGVWADVPATYHFTILKPWYKTNTALTLYLIGFIGSFVLLYRYLKWRWHLKNQLRLEHEETIRLKKLDEFKTKLYTNISHEIRTPLTLILGPVENQLNKKNISKEDTKELLLVKQNANRLLNLVNQMLDLSIIDSGQKRLKISKGSLTMLLKQIVEAFQYKASEKNIAIQPAITPLENVWFDTDIIEKVVSNLLSNAVKYAPNSSKIIFDVQKTNGTMVVSVINKTNQTTVSNLNNLFNRFYRDNEGSDGVGVGLALVRELVTLSKGNIIANNLGVDKIQFTVTLPIEKTAFNEDELVIETKKEVQESKVNANVDKTTEKPLVLIVEDDPEIRNFIVSIFKDTYKIIEAEDGQEGLSKILKALPDLIVSDVMMPNKSGIELCNDIKTNTLTSHIPVVLLTAKVGEQNEIEGYKTGADAYVTKPFSNEKLKLIVEKLLETRQKLKIHFSKTFSINPELAITSTENDFLKRVQTVLDEHITNATFTSEAFGELMGMSRTQLHRKLHAIVGMSTSEFIRSQRLKLAVKILETTDITIAEIAYSVGFNTPSYFNKCFKETYGCTPNEYLLKDT
ncbi:two-component regulator propeller domain-containing protein [Mariniflexile sp. HNIBRBA6329]|uniref:two-component regulator propeller domain-containing protein n=1 Tax=Mariniflexile sp. HNIBRBA6329 TaxID=3373088 RepID=UPI0037458929